jgi:hypothetical protein
LQKASNALQKKILLPTIKNALRQNI